MQNIKTIEISVWCPLESGSARPKKIAVRLIRQDGGPWFPLPCNTCEDAHAKLCEKCAASVTLQMFRSPAPEREKELFPRIDTE